MRAKFVAKQNDRLTQHIRFTTLTQISASPKLRICWKRYAQAEKKTATQQIDNEILNLE